MAYFSKNLRLVVWNQGEDTYDHTKLAANFDKIDEHDHSPTRGNRIGTDGLTDGLITPPKIADNAVVPSKIPNDSIGQDKLATNSVGNAEIIAGAVATAELADGSVTGPKLASGVLPLGIILPWYPRDASVGVPVGWALCEGQPWSSVPNDLGITTGNLPDTRNRFILGAASTGTGSTPGSPPDVGSVGGSHTINLAHVHVVPGHEHALPGHTHSISVQAPHTHRFWTKTYNANGTVASTYLTVAAQRNTAVPSAAGDRQSLFVPNLNVNSVENSGGGGVSAPMGPDEYNDGSAHNHGGTTGAGGGGITGTSGAQATTPAQGETDIRPSFIGLPHIIKVRI